MFQNQQSRAVGDKLEKLSSEVSVEAMEWELSWSKEGHIRRLQI